MRAFARLEWERDRLIAPRKTVIVDGGLCGAEGGRRNEGESRLFRRGGKVARPFAVCGTRRKNIFKLVGKGAKMANVSHAFV